MNKKIKILDCTIRDGGLALEDCFINNFDDLKFTKNKIERMILHLKNAKIDIIELGSIEISKVSKQCFGIYQSIEEISCTKPKGASDRQMFVALYRGPDTHIDNIPDWNNSLCEGVRVILRYSELEKSLAFCTALAKKGYRVFVQPMLTMRYTLEEINHIIAVSNDIDAYALYFVDSYGYMSYHDIERFLNLYAKKLKSNIKIGFHAHNNMNMALANALFFIKSDLSREVIVDTCALGFGQGAGNVPTELLAFNLNNDEGYQYCFPEILKLCDEVAQYIDENLCGYSPAYMIPAAYRMAYKYGAILRKKYRLSYYEINEILSKTDESIKQRYTADNFAILCKAAGRSDLLEI